MSHNKEDEQENVPIEWWKSLVNRGIEWHIKLFNEAMRSKKISNEPYHEVIGKVIGKY